MQTQFKQLITIGTIALSGLLFTSPVLSDTLFGTGGYNTQITKSTTSDYSKLFKQLDSNKNGTLEANEWVGTSADPEVMVSTGGYNREMRMRMAGKSINLDEFIMLQKPYSKVMNKSAEMEMDTDPQNWLSKQTGNS
ncbi:MAG: hypothetical protein U1E13_12190 [Methylophilaceae bacterium]|nr:hypothetical protein [Methylophilaceae bacterium]